jgi:uncharacterized protein YqjF (DUF2071 family)
MAAHHYRMPAWAEHRVNYDFPLAAQNMPLSKNSSVFLTAEWRELAMLNYAVSPDLLQQFVPRGTELDAWNGQYFVSLVGFRFVKTKVMGLPLPFHRNFDEVNLRFYVRRREGDEWRRGVVFIREIVPRWAIAAVARLLYNEKYVALPMSHRIERHEAGLDVQYRWTLQNRNNQLSIAVTGEAALPSEGSEAQFITEHFWGYSAQADGGCIEYRVDHPSWVVWSAHTARFEGDTAQLYGRELAAVLQREPNSGFLAAGSPVTVYRGRKI